MRGDPHSIGVLLIYNYIGRCLIMNGTDMTNQIRLLDWPLPYCVLSVVNQFLVTYSDKVNN